MTKLQLDINDSYSDSDSGRGTGTPRDLNQTSETALRQVTGETRALLFAGKYKILASLGRGGMADVYLAVMPGPAGFNKLVVVKKLRDSFTIEIDLVESFLDEAKLAARLNHNNIVHTFEVVSSEDCYFIAMEYLEGQPLNRLVRRLKSKQQKIPINLALRIVSESLGGLHYAHDLTDYDGTDLSVVHRDVSPQNIFITYDGEVKLLDFGIAKAALNSSQTQDGIMKGKVRYMAPEQARQNDIDRRVDVFAAGVVLWELVAGKRLLPNNAVECLQKLLFEPLPSARSIDPDIPEEVDAIITKAMEKDRDERYASAQEFKDAIDTYLHGCGEFVRASELGKLMSEHFAEDRSKRKAEVQRFMAAAPSTEEILAASDPEGLSSISSSINSAVSSSIRRQMDLGSSVSGSLRAETMTPSPQAAKRSKAYLAIAAGAIVIVGGASLIWVLSGSDGESPPPASSAPVWVPPVASADEDAKTVAFAVRAAPANATILVDDKPLPANPYSSRVPADDEVHWVVARADGHKEKAKSVRFQEDVILEFDLVPVDKKEEEDDDKKKGGPGRRYVGARVPPGKPPENKDEGEKDAGAPPPKPPPKDTSAFPDITSNPWENKKKSGNSDLEENPWN